MHKCKSCGQLLTFKITKPKGFDCLQRRS